MCGEMGDRRKFYRVEVKTNLRTGAGKQIRVCITFCNTFFFQHRRTL